MVTPDEISRPHDHFFKAVFSNPRIVARFLQTFVPAEIVSGLDLQSLQAEKDSFVDENLKEHFSDLLYTVQLESGQGACVYVLFEHKSTPERLTVFQVLRYLVRIWERSQTELQPVLPIVLYHGPRSWNAPVAFESLFEGPEGLRMFWPHFRIQLCDLSRFRDEDIKGEIMFRASLLLLKHVFDENLREQLPEILGLMKELTRQPTGLKFLETVLRYVASGSRLSREEVVAVVTTQLREGGEVLMGTFAEEYINIGLQKGIQQGIQAGIQQGIHQGIQQGIEQGHLEGLMEGRREGLLAGIELALQIKFGVEGLRALPEIRKIRDIDVLQAIHEALKTAGSIAELRRVYAE